MKWSSPYDPNEDQLALYVASLTMARPGKPHGLAQKSIRVYLSAIAHFHALENKRDPKEGKPQFAKMLTGVKRMQGTASKPKRPITLSLLKEMKKHIPTGTLEGMVHWAVLCMGVHGLFRLGELLPPTGEGTPLTRTEVTWVSGDHVTVFLKKSKVDRYGAGTYVNLFATGDETCPLEALRSVHRMQAAKGMNVTHDVPLFKTGKGVIDKKSVIALLKRTVGAVAKRLPHLGLQSKDFAGHSLRRGGATSLALRGVRESILRMLGRWKSDAVNLYIEVPVDSLQKASQIMAMTPETYRHADLAAAGSLSPLGEMVMDL